MKAWFESLVAFMSKQPASHEIHLMLESPALPEALALAPWISGLHVTMGMDRDVSEAKKVTMRDKGDIGRALQQAVKVSKVPSSWLPSRSPPS